ncbi:Zinc finger, RING-type [Sesbania bispinosa]|nr:Zinc finger, RING-type [Sesbania bispinosa]
MGDRGEKSCPICTEEMDLTDQQLKPCKCGYEICVWCWHHIMEMAQKDETEGRCPACRSPYDKERIVAMAANCQRLVAEMNSRHKKKMQKLKPKSSEGRKHLSDVRVIQRNLVYIIGLPLNLADEDLLQRREYFGRYGKVLKVSISRTASGTIQHSANNSCCVYITYSRESEAVRCIQSVHCFVLEGRPLRACFGTTKYCHAWLRNVPCSNRECLYLHDHGSHEDSFTKDELVLAFARSRVQQIIGATNNLHRRSGSVLPPPADDPRHMSSATKLASKSPLDITGSCSGIGSNSTALPPVTSWVRCVSGSLPQDTSSSCSSNLANRKVEASNDPQALMSGVACTERPILNTRRSGEAENNSEVHSNGVFIPSESNKNHIDGNSQTSFMGNDQDMTAPSVSTSFVELSRPCCDFNIDKAVSNGDVQGLCSGLSSISINGHLEDSYFTPDSDRLPFTHNSINSSIRKHLQQDNEYCEEHSTTPAFWEDIIVDDILKLDYEHQKFSKGMNGLSSRLCSPCLPQKVNQSNLQPRQQDQICHQNYLGKTSGSFTEPLETGFEKHIQTEDDGTGVDNKVVSEMGENNIISNILSLEDAWEDSLVKLLGESDEPYAPFKAPTLRKVQDKNQSRFSFARQDDFMIEESDLQQSFGITGHDPKANFASDGLMGNKDRLTGKHPLVFPSSNSVLADKFVGSQPFVSSKFFMAKAHASSPPGFALSSRIPPGFSCGRVEQGCNSSVNHLQQQYVPPSVNIGRIGDVEFNNPAVLDLGQGILEQRLNNASFDLRQTLLPQFSPDEDDARLKLLMQQSIPSQNSRLPDHIGNRFSPQSDANRISSRFLDQFQSNTPSIYEQLHSQQFSNDILTSNNQWGGWNDAKYFSGLSITLRPVANQFGIEYPEFHSIHNCAVKWSLLNLVTSSLCHQTTETMRAKMTGLNGWIDLLRDRLLVMIAFLRCDNLVRHEVQGIGVNYGTVANNLPPPAKVAKFLSQSTTINRVRIFDANPEILHAFANTGIEITITVPNDQIPHITNLSFAQQWVKTNVQPFIPATKLIRILVGNEVLSTANKLLISNLVPAMQTLHTALVAASIDNHIKVSTPHSLGILSSSSPPSSGKFRQGYDTHILKPMLSFLKDVNAPFMVNPYPFFGCSPDTIDYALFRENSGVFDDNTKLQYTNMLDAQLDAVYSAMKVLGFEDIEIVIAETGWPSVGDPAQIGADPKSASDYNRNLIRHITSGAGTPLMPNRTFDTYVFALFDENLKPGPICERNFGLFWPNMTPVYNIPIMRNTVVANNHSKAFLSIMVLLSFIGLWV